MSLTLPDFLARALDADEAAALAASPGEWRYDPSKVNSVDRQESVFAGERGLGATTVASTGPEDDPQSMADATHIARHDPVRVLAEVASKRRILEDLILPYIAERRRLMNGQPLWSDENPDILRHLAAPYSSEPDFDPSWAVS